MLPRGPVFNERSESMDVSSDYQSGMREWVSSATHESNATARQDPEQAKRPEYVRLLEGEFWNRRRPGYRSTFNNNRLERVRIDTLSVLTDIRPTIEVHTAIPEYEKQAEIARKVIIAEWTKQEMDLVLEQVIDLALMGTAFWKITCCAPGAMKVTACGPDMVKPLNPHRSMQQSTGMVYESFKAADYFVRNFGRAAVEKIKNSSAPTWMRSENARFCPPHIDQVTWENLTPQMKQLVGVKEPGPNRTSLFQPVMLQEFWIDDPSVNESMSTVVVKHPELTQSQHNWWYLVPPGYPLYPRKRLIVTANGVPIYDGPSPYFHGLYPFAMLQLNPVIWNWYGLSKYRDLLPLHRASNEIVAGVLDTIKKAINPQLIYREGSISDSTMRGYYPDMPGGKLRVNSSASIDRDIQWSDAPNLPAYVVDMLLRFLGPEFDRASGFFDVQRLMGKGQVPGGDTLEQMRDSIAPSQRREQRMIESFLRNTGQIMVSNIFQFYSQQRRMAMLGRDGTTFEEFDYDPASMMPTTRGYGDSPSVRMDHWLNFALQIVPGSLHGASRDREQQKAMAMFKMGAISARELMRRLDWTNIDQIMKEREEEEKLKEAVAQGSGAEVHDTSVDTRMTRGARNGNPV